MSDAEMHKMWMTIHCIIHNNLKEFVAENQREFKNKILTELVQKLEASKFDYRWLKTHQLFKVVEMFNFLPIHELYQERLKLMRVILELEFSILTPERMNEVMRFAASVKDDIKLNIDFKHKLTNVDLECKFPVLVI